jgi:hypothetical protein
MKSLIYVPIFFAASCLMWINIVFAASASLPFSTSFVGCTSDVYYSTSGWACGTNPANVVYSTTNGATVCSSNGYQQISTAADHPGGTGGKGWRRWVCGATSGNTPSTGSLTVNMTHTSELWIRFYMRWQPGFEWNSSAPAGLFYQKVFYIRPMGGDGAVMDLSHADNMTMTTQGGGGIGSGTATVSANCSQRCGWNTMNPNGAMQANGVRLGDGSWHSIEVHVKDQSGSGTYDGEWDLWIDGVLKSHVTGINYNYGVPSGIDSIQMMINQSTPSNPTPMYNDIDDIEVSHTGYIGPLGPSTRPNPPTGLR